MTSIYNKSSTFKDYAENPTLEELAMDLENLWIAYNDSKSEVDEMKKLVSNVLEDIKTMEGVMSDILNDIRGIEEIKKKKIDDFLSNTGLHIADNLEPPKYSSKKTEI